MKGIWPSHHDPTQENLGQKLLDYNACSWRTRQQPEQQRGQDEKKRRPHPSSIILPPHVVCGSFALLLVNQWPPTVFLTAKNSVCCWEHMLRHHRKRWDNQLLSWEQNLSLASTRSSSWALRWSSFPKPKLDWCSFHIERRIPNCNKRVQNLAWLIKEKIWGLPPRK